jgi:hypothetical protein
VTNFTNISHIIPLFTEFKVINCEIYYALSLRADKIIYFDTKMHTSMAERERERWLFIARIKPCLTKKKRDVYTAISQRNISAELSKFTI